MACLQPLKSCRGADVTGAKSSVLWIKIAYSDPVPAGATVRKVYWSAVMYTLSFPCPTGPSPHLPLSHVYHCLLSRYPSLHVPCILSLLPLPSLQFLPLLFPLSLHLSLIYWHPYFQLSPCFTLFLSLILPVTLSFSPSLSLLALTHLPASRLSASPAIPTIVLHSLLIQTRENTDLEDWSRRFTD